MAEVRRALTDAAVPIDILACDTCLSADVALAYDVSTTGLVDYLVASEESVPGDGFCYDAMLGPLIADPALPTADVLTAQVDGYERYYRGLPFLAPTSLSAIDLAAVRDMLPDLRVWSQELRAALATEPGAPGHRRASQSRARSGPRRWTSAPSPRAWPPTPGSGATRSARLRRRSRRTCAPPCSTSRAPATPPAHRHDHLVGGPRRVARLQPGLLAPDALRRRRRVVRLPARRRRPRDARDVVRPARLRLGRPCASTTCASATPCTARPSATYGRSA